MSCRAFVAALLAVFASAAGVASPVSDIASYEGADRAQRLAEGARREGGVLNVYTSLTLEDMAALNAAFEAKQQVKRRGAPLDWFAIPPVVARANGLALAKHAQHPHAALLYYDFMLGEEAQRMLVERGFMPASRMLRGPLPVESLHVVDPAMILDQSQKWTKLYESVFINAR